MTSRRHLHVGQIREILERVLGVIVCDPGPVKGRDYYGELAKDLEDVLANVAPDCLGCRKFHESYPTMRHFHHPGCPDKRNCAMCGNTMTWEPSVNYGHEVGLICETCYGEEAP